jgi:hypothetical protein
MQVITNKLIGSLLEKNKYLAIFNQQFINTVSRAKNKRFNTFVEMGIAGLHELIVRAQPRILESITFQENEIHKIMNNRFPKPFNAKSLELLSNYKNLIGLKMIEHNP